MRTPALALAWEIWRKHRAANLCVVALLPLSAILYASFAIWIPDMRAFPGRPSPAWPLLLFPMLGSLVWVMNVFTNTEGDARRGFTGMPPRFFTLPVRTAFLVGCLAGLGIGFLALMYLAWAGTIQWVTGFALPLLWPVLALAAVMVCFQAVVWGLASFPWIRILVIGAGALGVVILAAILIDAGVSERTRRITLTAVLGGLIPFGGLAAWLGVTAERSGGWQVWDRLIPLLRKAMDALPRRTRSFASPCAAQFWFEWRRRGWFLTAGFALSLAASAMMFPVTAMMDPGEGVPWRGLISALFYPLFLSGLAGLGLARTEFWSKEVQIQPFQALRPITDADLYLAKLRVAGGIISAGWLLAVPLTWAVMSWPQWRDLWHLDQAGARLLQFLPGHPLKAGLVLLLSVFVLVALTWRIMIAALCLGLTGHSRKIAIQPFIGCGGFLIVVLGGGWLSQRPELLENIQPYLIVLLVAIGGLKIFATARALHEIQRRSLLPGWMLSALVVLWLAVAGALIGFTTLLWNEMALSKPIVFLALAWAWPGGELFQGIIHLEANRHR